jgi:hypothetical protein
MSMSALLFRSQYLPFDSLFSACHSQLHSFFLSHLLIPRDCFSVSAAYDNRPTCDRYVIVRNAGVGMSDYIAQEDETRKDRTEFHDYPD